MDYLRHNFRAKYQYKIVPSHACTARFKVSTMKLYVIEEQNNMKQTTFILSVELIRETIEILKTKTYLTFFFVVLSNH
jgi:hypothetical protein